MLDPDGGVVRRSACVLTDGIERGQASTSADGAGREREIGR